VHNQVSRTVHRALLLFIGLAAVVFFGTWGLIAYQFFVVAYCRVAANKIGVRYYRIAYPPEFYSSSGNFYAVSIFILFALTVFWGMFAQYYELVQSQALYDLFSERNLKRFLPKCTGVGSSVGSDCVTFNQVVGIASLLFPFAVFLTFNDMVNFSRSRIRSKTLSFMVYFAIGLIFLSTYLFPVNLESYYSLIRFSSSFFLSYLILLIPARITH